MLDVKYKDKAYLREYDLDPHLFEKFDIVVKDIIPIRNVYILRTEQGDKILKKVDYSLDKLKFIYEAIQYIKVNFHRVIDFTKTREGHIYELWDNEIYCMMDLIEGRECEFSNPLDVGIAAKGLGELHKASEGFRYPLPERNTTGKVIAQFKRRLEEIRFFKHIVQMYEHLNEFDELFMKNVDGYMAQIEDCIKYMESTQYYKLCSEEDKVVLCHHDLAYHNILISNEDAYFVDFDFAVIDVKVHDLSNYINKAIKNYAFDMEKAELILQNYCLTNSLDKRELQVLYGLLCFPEDFYTITRDYYTRRKKWDEEVFLFRLKKKLEYKEDAQEFMEAFKKYI